MLNDGDIAVVFAVNVLEIDFARHGIRFHLRDLLVTEDGFDIVNEIIIVVIGIVYVLTFCFQSALQCGKDGRFHASDKLNLHRGVHFES